MVVSLASEYLVLEPKKSTVWYLFLGCLYPYGSHCFPRLPWITLSSVFDAEQIVV